MGIVRLASLGTGIISAITPDWVANKLWQPILRSVEDAIVKENQVRVEPCIRLCGKHVGLLCCHS